jgi:signal-transduction protein with cAMP-binding, CBS, and nucleotidyltransferase domain
VRTQRGEQDEESRASAQAVRPAASANRVNPYALNELDQRMLKESFRQARALQQQLEQAFGQ